MTELHTFQTLLRQANASLAETEHWLRQVADTTSSALLISRWEDGALLWTNRRFRDLVCLNSEAEARSRFASEFYSSPAEGTALRKTLATRDKVRWEGEFRRLDGTPFRAAGSVHRSVYKGQPALFSVSQTIAEADIETEPVQSRGQGFTMLDALVAAVDNKDRYTRRHSEDVMRYSLQIARNLGLPAEALRTIEMAALLHDVGKIGVPNAILRKSAKLTDEEFETVKLHAGLGAIFVSAVPGLEGTLDAVRHHHERWDGGGYPGGLVGEETPLPARLMAVADAYSAMTTDRPYRKGMAPEKARAILEEGAGSQWDPACVQAFVSEMETGTGSAGLLLNESVSDTTE